MTALTANRPTEKVSPNLPIPLRDYAPIADNVHIYQGGMVQLDVSGRAVPAGTSGAVGMVVGRSVKEYDNTVTGHAAAAFVVEYEFGAFYWDIGSTGDALVQADAGASVYALDDHTVAKTYGTAAYGTVVHTGTGVSPGMTVTGTPLAINANESIGVEVNIILGGAVATATFQYRILSRTGTGQWSATTTTASTVAITNGLTLNFAAGTYVLGDTYTHTYGGDREVAGKLLGVRSIPELGTQALVLTIPGLI
jgi:hypothetical protein